MKAEEEQTSENTQNDKKTTDKQEEEQEIEGVAVMREEDREDGNLLFSLPCLLPSVLCVFVCVWDRRGAELVACRTTFSLARTG